MNPIRFALRHPITIIVAMVALLVGGAFAIRRMKVDIFPALNLPVVYVCQPYGGMDPQQMEGMIANYYEYHFLYISGIHHVESKNVQGVSLMKLFFHPGTDMAQALAETVGYVNRSRAFMPPGTVPPFIMRFDTGSVPVGYLVLSSETKSVGEIQDQALFKVRPMFGAIDGVSAPPPFGGNQRTVVVRTNPDRLRSYGLSADDVVRALASGNAISPSGAIRIGDKMPLTPIDSMVVKPQDLGAIEVKPGVFMRDIVRRDSSTDRPMIDDASDVATGYALINGKRAVYIVVTKRANASTLAVVNGVRAELPKMQSVLPEDIRVTFEFDQSQYVSNSIWTVGVEAVLAAGLVGLMVLLFLRDWRSVIVVVLNIPLALLGAIIALWLTGQTINLMTLGGLALAVGILVDEATVEVENIFTQMRRTPSVPLAVRWGNAETAVPRLLAMLCVLAVFIPSFALQGAAQALFVPLSLSVGFAMIASYVLSSTLVPVLAVWLLRKHEQDAEHSPAVARLMNWYGETVQAIVRRRGLLIPGYVLLTGGIILLLGRDLGTEIFPQVDAGMFQFRLKAATGTRIEQTEEITQEALRFIGDRVGSANMKMSLAYVGQVPSSYPINSVYLWTGGPEEAVVRVAVKPGATGIERLKAELRLSLAEHLRHWLRDKWQRDNVTAEEIASRSADVRLSFEPADIVNEVMSFGSPTPVEVVVSGPKPADNRAHAARLFAELAHVEGLCDLQYVQAVDYPTVEIHIDREKAAQAGVDAASVARAVTPFTSSSRFTVPNYWRDPVSGIGYQVQVEVPQNLVKSMKDLENIPVPKAGSADRVLLGDIGDVRENTMAGEIHRYNMRRLVSMTANIRGSDLGRVAKRIDAAIASVGTPPPGVQVDVRGQVATMKELFQGLAQGLGIAVVVILLMLSAYYQSLPLSLTAVASVPAVLAGVAAMLWLTRTTLNLQSFMGSIMAIGVAVANAILLVTFADRARREGRTPIEAAIEAARGRLRPILMTSAAMIAGMTPMALGFGEGGDQTAPLGRAVVGGLFAATATTLLFLPGVYVVLVGKRPAGNASLDPFDVQSPRHVPNAATNPPGMST